MCGFALGVTAVNRNDRLPVNDPHKKWGVAIFCIYLAQVAFGAAVHFVKRPLLPVRGRALQNYVHPLLGVFLIGIALYQVRAVPCCEGMRLTRAGAHGLPHGVAAVHWPREGAQRREYRVDHLARRMSPSLLSHGRVLTADGQLVPTFYFGGMVLLPRQYKQERAAREAQMRADASDAGSTEPVQPKAE